MARITLRASTVVPPEIPTSKPMPPVLSVSTSRVSRKVAPNTHACWYARCASSAPLSPREKPR